MILRTLAPTPLHGYAIARRIEAASGGTLDIEEGSLYPALHRLEKRGDLIAEWRITEANRRAKFYSLTKSGRKSLDEQVSAWKRVAGAVDQVLGLRPAPLRGSPS